MDKNIANNNGNKKERRTKADLFMSSYDTKQHLSKEKIACLDDIALFYNYHKRKYNKVGVFNADTRKQYVQNATFKDQQGIQSSMSYRFFQGILQDVKGLHKSIQSNRENYLVVKQDTLIEVDKVIKKVSKKYHNLIANQQKIFNHNFEIEKENLLKYLRKLYMKRQYILNAIANLEDKDGYSICFGTKKLMKKRHRIKDEFELEDWKKEWTLARNGQFMLSGSWDENFGNSNCQVNYNHEGQFSMKIRIPYELESKYGEYLILENLTIPNYLKVPLKREINKHRFKVETKNALSFRFIKENDNTYRILFTLNQDNVKIKTHSKKGVIGVDVNADHFAVVEINEKGAIQNAFDVPLDLENKTANQRKAIIEKSINTIRDYALKKKKNIVIENLNFKEKRDQLHKNYNKDYARMLSSFAYTQIMMGFERLSSIHGVKVKKESPAYTSVLGFMYAADKSMTTHQAAAYMIARRYYKFKEKIKHQFMLVHKARLFIVNVPREIQSAKSFKLLKRWISDVRQYIAGSCKIKSKIVQLSIYVTPLLNDSSLKEPPLLRELAS